MKRLVLIGLIGFLGAATLPGVGPRVRPLLGPVPGWMDAVATRVTAPLVRWNARSEASHLMRTLARWHSDGKALPLPSEFGSFARRHLNADREGLDPWGRPYFVRYFQDSVTIASPGADGIPESDDDVRVSTPWN